MLVRRHAREFEPLREVLSALDEGYAPVVESVRDLLDAGLDESNAEFADDALAAVGEDVRVVRARALVTLAMRVQREMDAQGLPTPAALFVRARQALTDNASLGAASPVGRNVFAATTRAKRSGVSPTMRRPRRPPQSWQTSVMRCRSITAGPGFDCGATVSV